MKEFIIKTKKDIYRSCAVSFVIILFGALAAGFINVLQILFNNPHLLSAFGEPFEKTFLYLMFWATDFFFVGFTLVLCYKIAGIPAIAPSLTLAVYFAHFSGEKSFSATQMYHAYFATPAALSEGVNIGYMGYFILALMLSILIKLLFIAWDKIKTKLGKKLSPTVNKIMTKIGQKEDENAGITLLENLDLIVLILIIPAVSTIITWLFIQNAIAIPFALLAEKLFNLLSTLSTQSIVLTALVMGLMTGFDIIGPLSVAAFSFAVSSVLSGDARLMTIYSACFITIGWVPVFDWLFSTVIKKSGKRDTDDMNIAVSGPINAFFENIKLTVAFSMPYAYRSPLTVIPGLMIGSSSAGILCALFKIVNNTYLDTTAHANVDFTLQKLFEMGERYISFTLPLRSGDWFTCRIPLFFIVLFSGAIGGITACLLRCIETKISIKNGTYVEAEGDIVKELRLTASKWAKTKH